MIAMNKMKVERLKGKGKIQVKMYSIEYKIRPLMYFVKYIIFNDN